MLYLALVLYIRRAAAALRLATARTVEAAKFGLGEALGQARNKSGRVYRASTEAPMYRFAGVQPEKRRESADKLEI